MITVRQSVQVRGRQRKSLVPDMQDHATDAAVAAAAATLLSVHSSGFVCGNAKVCVRFWHTQVCIICVATSFGRMPMI